MPNYVTASGYTETISARPKVGDPQAVTKMVIYDIVGDTTYAVNTASIPGIKDLPDYASEADKKDSKAREVFISGPFWSDNGENNAVVVSSLDNKDRWIMTLNLNTGEMQLLDRQRDEAWIAGPGIGWTYGSGNVGWMPDNRRFWFQSEASGYSHLYAVDVETGKKEAFTSGEFEVFNPYISHDKKSWYFISSEVNPGERHLYKMPLNGGKVTKLTHMPGNSEVLYLRMKVRWPSGILTPTNPGSFI